MLTCPRRLLTIFSSSRWRRFLSSWLSPHVFNAHTLFHISRFPPLPSLLLLLASALSLRQSPRWPFPYVSPLLVLAHSCTHKTALPLLYALHILAQPPFSAGDRFLRQHFLARLASLLHVQLPACPKCTPPQDGSSCLTACAGPTPRFLQMCERNEAYQMIWCASRPGLRRKLISSQILTKR